MSSMLALYAVPLIVIFIYAASKRLKAEKSGQLVFADNLSAGLTQPASIHPVVDTRLCIGCESCIHACPEFPAHQVLGLVAGKAELVSPTDCIGHGACANVCPVNAISLVFGTKAQGVELPVTSSDFETNQPDLFIAGELGGMGLIRNALEQGKQAMNTIVERLDDGRKSDTDALDVLIVGAGPAGLAASLAAKEAGLKFRTIDQDNFGGSVANFPKRKLVMTAPAELPIIGKTHFKLTTKEELMDFWLSVRKRVQLPINAPERLVQLTRSETGGHQSSGVWRATTDQGEHVARAVLLAIGRRGTPRQLGVPGEDLSKVSYRMIDPDGYDGRHVMVVGGGDSALEAACSIAESGAASVALVYRQTVFKRAKRGNRERLEELAKRGTLSVHTESEPIEINPDNVKLKCAGGIRTLDNDDIIICAGGTLPTGFLKETGIATETKYGTA